MSSILVPADRELILQRLHRLTPESQAAWGTFTAPRLLCHLSDQLRVALGAQPITRHDTALTRTLLKWLVVYSPLRAPPGKVVTSPEMLISAPGDWNTDIQACDALIRRLALTPTTAVHPRFGPLSYAGWGRLVWKHLDHHLRQFHV